MLVVLGGFKRGLSAERKTKFQHCFGFSRTERTEGTRGGLLPHLSGLLREKTRTAGGWEKGGGGAPSAGQWSQKGNSRAAQPSGGGKVTRYKRKETNANKKPTNEGENRGRKVARMRERKVS